MVETASWNKLGGDELEMRYRLNQTSYQATSLILNICIIGVEFYSLLFDQPVENNPILQNDSKWLIVQYKNEYGTKSRWRCMRITPLNYVYA